MSDRRHSYVHFYPSDWKAYTARMTRLEESVCWDVCVRNWGTGEPVPLTELERVLADIDDGGAAVLARLISTGKLHQDDRGVWCEHAIAETEIAQLYSPEL